MQIADSVDGRRIAYVRNDHVWVYDTDLGTQTQLTRLGTRHHNPVWSPDGNRLAYAAQGDSGQGVEVFVKDAPVEGAIELFAGSPDDEYPAQWLPDGTVLAQTLLGRQDIVAFRRGATIEVTPVLQADWAERSPSVSPDGQWLAFVSHESGLAELYVPLAVTAPASQGLRRERVGCLGG